MIHELKIKPEYFAAVVTGDKTFEIRNNADRNFQVGDTLLLWEWNGGFTGRTAERTVSYITDFEQKPGYVVLGLANKREQELADQLTDSTRQCGVMAGLLREVTRMVPAIGVAIDDLPVVDAFLDRIEAALAGKLPDPAVTVTETIRTAPERIWLQVGDQEHYHSEPFPRDTTEVSWCADSVVGCEVPYVRADLAGKLPDPAMPEGWKLVEKANCFTLVSDGQVIASMAGPTAEGTAAILASVLDGKVSRPANQDDLVSVSDIASLQRYTLGSTAHTLGRTYDAEMEEDDEGEYVLLADALMLANAPEPEHAA